MARTFSQMIYKDGFVHCDPHPGNVLIRPAPPGSLSPRNFEIVLLDHGLYRELTPEFRLDYARLWTAIIASNEEEIKYRALKLGGTDAYQLFSTILTGRDWSVVQKAELATKARNKDEMVVLGADGTGTRIAEIADILAKVPRNLLLLFKTNDLLRALDEDLGADDGSQMRTFAVMGQYCAHAIYEADKSALLSRLNTSRLTVSFLAGTLRTWLKAYCGYLYTTLSLDAFMWWINLTQSDSLLSRLFSRVGLVSLNR